MKEREKIIVGGLVTFLMLIWLGFLLHVDPDFPGSAPGLSLGIAGTLLMMVPLAYSVIKRIKPLRKSVTRKASMRTLLAWHIYAGVLGPVLVLLHTGHKFESPIGIALTGMTLIVVLSGFIGRYLMAVIGREIREKKNELDELRSDYDLVVRRLRENHAIAGLAQHGIFRAILVRLTSPLLEGVASSPERQAIRLSESIADVEYALRTHRVFKRAFSKWLKLHIVISGILYLLLALHVFSELYYGLRWLS